MLFEPCNEDSRAPAVQLKSHCAELLGCCSLSERAHTQLECLIMDALFNFIFLFHAFQGLDTLNLNLLIIKVYLVRL